MSIPVKKQPINAYSSAKNSAGKSRGELEKEETSQFPLARKNFIFMTAAGALIIIGFLLMLGGGSTTEQFNPDIFSTRRVVVGPTLAFLGFVAMGIAIIIKPGKKSREKSAGEEAKEA